MKSADEIRAIKALGVRRYKDGDFELEFFEDKPMPMNLDPKNLASVLTESMPPDSAMLFASSEGVPDENPTSQQREADKMT